MIKMDEVSSLNILFENFCWQFSPSGRGNWHPECPPGLPFPIATQPHCGDHWKPQHAAEYHDLGYIHSPDSPFIPYKRFLDAKWPKSNASTSAPLASSSSAVEQRPTMAVQWRGVRPCSCGEEVGKLFIWEGKGLKSIGIKPNGEELIAEM